MIKALILSKFGNYDHLIGLITIANECNDVWMMETGNHLEFITELVVSLTTIPIKAFDGYCAFIPFFRELPYVDETESTISNQSFRTEVSCGPQDFVEWNPILF